MHYKTLQNLFYLLKRIHNSIILRSSVIILIFGAAFVPCETAFAHLYGYNVQEWKNDKQNILVQFEPDPPTPSVGENSTLEFSVQDLKTGNHLTNFTKTVTITFYNGNNESANDLVYKSDSSKVKDGDFSQPYVFTKGGTYEIFLRVDTPLYINVSKFVVFVSSPQFQIMNMVYLLLPFIIISGIFTGIGIVIWKRLYKKDDRSLPSKTRKN